MGSGLEAGQKLSENGKTPPWLSGPRLTLGCALRVSRRGQAEPGTGPLDCQSAVGMTTGKSLHCKSSLLHLQRAQLIGHQDDHHFFKEEVSKGSNPAILHANHTMDLLL